MPDTSGTEISGYFCTATFDFTDEVNDANLDLAVNSVSWKCDSDLILLSCTYMLVSYIAKNR